VSASFEPSSGSLNPLEGIAFCRKVISVLRPLYPPILETPCLKILKRISPKRALMY
jgi:hypothetical protein